MGMLTKLLTAPLLPVRLVTWAAQRALDQANEEYYDPAPVYAALAELERALRDGEIDQAGFDRQRTNSSTDSTRSHDSGRTSRDPGGRAP
ncbi:gas vesicle protein GvpG [Streptomyces sp. NPDC096319]|uniref:gas vesicle protein GvpG n=1 Tax=Streptomyces sp. NPDC096319 TaxID=3366084 RepID=UPI0038302C71